MQPSHSRLIDVQNFMTAITGRIMQVSDRKASVALGAATKTAIGASFAALVMGFVGVIGNAGTGTAIASLAGAAKTTASLYWIGGLVGGGVAAGAFVVGAGALGVGIYGSVKVRRAILGHSRRNELSDREQRIVFAIHALVQSIRDTIESGKRVSDRELVLFSRIGITPIVTEVQAALDEGVFSELKFYNRAQLRGHLNNLKALQAKLEQK